MKRKKKQSSEINQQSILTKKSYNNKPIFFIWGIISIYLIISFLLIPDIETRISYQLPYSYFIIFNLLSSTVLFLILQKTQNKKVKNILKYLFVSILFSLLIISFVHVFELSEKQVIFYLKLKTFLPLISFLGITAGILTVWSHKEEFRNTVHRFFSKKNSPPKNNFFKKSNLPYLFALLIIACLSSYTVLYKLGNFDFFSDETQTIQGATGYYHSGEYVKWSFSKNKLTETKYNRAKPHIYLIAQSYKLFGISEWSSRFPSALFAVILIIAGYFIGVFFFKDKTAVLLAFFTFVFFFEFLFLQRWTRMYAILLPLYLAGTYFFFRFLTEINGLNIPILKKKLFLLKILNYNFLLLPILAILLYVNYKLHPNSLLIFIIFFVFIGILYFTDKDKKYIFAFFIGILLLVYQIIFPFTGIFEKVITFFKVDNGEYYRQAIIGYPFSIYPNIVIISTAIYVIFISKNKNFQQKYILPVISGLIAFVLFSYILKRYESFKYLSFIIPLILLFIISGYFLIFRTLFPKFIIIIFSLLLMANVVLLYQKNYKALYIENFVTSAKPSIAYKSIVKDYTKGEIIYRHWGPDYYFSGIDSSVQFKLLGHYAGKSFKTIYDTIQNYAGVWFVWDSNQTHRMDKTFIAFAEKYFTKYHGYGVDSTNVEIYHFTKNMFSDSVLFLEKDIFIPTANLNTKNSYSIATWLALTPTTLQTPFYFHNLEDTVFTLNIDKNNQNLVLKHKNDSINILKSNNIANGKLHHVVYYQTGGKKGDKFGIIIDGKKIREKKFTNDISELVKIKVNPFFKGSVDDIRVYNFVLNESQIKTIMKSKEQLKSNILFSGNKKFETLFHWQKN